MGKGRGVAGGSKRRHVPKRQKGGHKTIYIPY